MSPSALDKTRNLIALYLHTCGRSEVPAAYHLWSFLTAMAALLADRVYFTKFAHAPLRPNLYTFLIGPSGGGKGEAIDSVLQFVDIIEEASEVFEGATTGQALMEHLGERKSKDNKERRGAILLVHEELSMDVGEGPIAAAFIKHMMGLYKGVLGKALKKRTIVRGAVTIPRALMNWLAGTTLELLIEAVPRAALEGGFIGRAAVVRGEYAPHPIRKPEYPLDREQVMLHIQNELSALAQTRGEMTLTPAAEEIDEQWYTRRHAFRPSDDRVFPSWRREHDLVYKLSMILAKAEQIETQLIDTRHIIKAQELTSDMMRFVPAVLDAANASPEARRRQVVVRTLLRAKRIQHSALLRRVSRSDVNGKQLREIMADLIADRTVWVDRGQVYVVRRRVGPLDITEVDEHEEQAPDGDAADSDGSS